MKASVLKVLLMIEITPLLEICLNKYERVMKALFGRWHNFQNHLSEYISNKLF